MQTTPSLYFPQQEHARLMLLIEAAQGEMTPEVLAALALNEQNVATRVGSLLDLLDVSEANVQLGKQKLAQVSGYIKSNEHFIARVRGVLTEAVKSFGPLSTDTRKLSLRHDDVVVIDDATKIPDQFRAPIPVLERGQPNKLTIKAGLRSGWQIEGAHLEKSTKLVIK